MTATIIIFPRTRGAVGGADAPAPSAYDPYAKERRLKQLDAALVQWTRTKHGASDPSEGIAPCDIEPEPAA